MIILFNEVLKNNQKQISLQLVHCLSGEHRCRKGTNWLNSPLEEGKKVKYVLDNSTRDGGSHEYTEFVYSASLINEGSYGSTVCEVGFYKMSVKVGLLVL